MLADAGVTTLVTQEYLRDRTPWPASVRLVTVEGTRDRAPDVDLESFCRAALERPTPDTAYVIYTSGSTGAPKGVRISHRGALNTVEDVNRRFGVGEDDAVLGLANLGFDLSVYDMFGPLAVGGSLVIPDHDQRGMPAHWANLIQQHRVTLWNSVPAHLQMLADFLPTAPAADVSSLRLALLSGDWIPVNLPDRTRRLVPDLEVVSLGGATEGSIWSIHYPIGVIDERWSSIPYGTPLTNQRMYVLDRRWRECPDGVTGEIFISGAGVAVGYLGDPERTAERFVEHPRTGERLYRTGDLGRYLPDGTIEFLGREDGQVKIRGHRIELAEVEAALVSDPRVAAAAVVLDKRSRHDPRLVAFVEPGAAVDTGAAERAGEVARSAAAVADRSTGDVDRIEYVGYLRHLDDVALLCMLRTFQGAGLFQDPEDVHSMDEILHATRASTKHHRVVRRWVRALTRHELLVEEGAGRFRARCHVEDADIAEGWREVDDMVARLDPGSVQVHDYFKAATDRLLEVLRSDGADAVQLLFPEGRIDIGDSLYNVTLFNRWANRILAESVTTIARTRPSPLRVLEVGAGVGGTSKDVIPALAGFDVEYVFTDLSQFFLNRARETFGEYPWVRYATLDINSDYRAQGFSPNSFDVVVLGDVFHATRHVGRTLESLRELLASGGWLLFAEMTREHYQIMTSMELLLTDGRTEDFADMRRGRDQTFVEHHDWLSLLGDDLVFALPREDDPFTEVGLYVYGSRVKADRALLRPQQVLQAAARRLPQVMVPSAVGILDHLPVTANGKIDRGALLGLIPTIGADADADSDAAPDDLERRLSALWSEVLGRPAVGRSQGFYDLGGDSLLASQLAGATIEGIPEARSMSFNTVLRVLLEGPTVSGLAARLRDST
jgi:pyochelin synthetase